MEDMKNAFVGFAEYAQKRKTKSKIFFGSRMWEWALGEFKDEIIFDKNSLDVYFIDSSNEIIICEKEHFLLIVEEK